MENEEIKVEEKREIKEAGNSTDTKTKPFYIYKILTFLLAAILVVVLGILVRNWYVENQADSQYEDLAAQVNKTQNPDSSFYEEESIVSGTEMIEGTEEQEDSEVVEPDILEQLGIEIPEKNMDWSLIHEVNEDIYAWIYIPGTEIDYPILQHPTDDTYYLDYNMNGTKGYPGCIYTERVNSMDFTDFDTVVYGHNMRDSSMFATLHYFENPAFFNNVPYIYIYTGDKVLVIEIFAAYMGDDQHILSNNDFSTETGRQIYLDTVTKYNVESAMLRDVDVSVDSHILTLSTCVKGKTHNRFLVQAVLLNEDELYE